MQLFSYAILLAATFIIETQAFCIYNFLDEGGSFNIYDALHSDNFGSFLKTLGPGAKECCNFSNKDCNPSQKSTKDVYFQVKFTFNQVETPTFLTKCTGGGALAFYGSATDFYALCTPADLRTHQALLDKDPLPLNNYKDP